MPDPVSTVLQCTVENSSIAVPLIMAGTAALVAFFSIKSSREIARKQATIALFERSIENELLTNAMNVVRKVHEHPEINIEEYTNSPKDNLNEGSFLEVKNAIRKVLNFHEHICIGISSGIYDESVFKQHRKQSTIELWSMTEKYIAERRKLSNNPKVFEHLEEQVKKWR